MGQEVVRHGFKFVLAFLRAVSEGANVVAFCWEFRIVTTDMERIRMVIAFCSEFSLYV